MSHRIGVVHTGGMRSLRSIDRWYARFRETGDVSALARVFDATAPELARVAMYLTADAHRAEDLLQDTFLTALTRASSYDRDQPVLPWLLAILANRARQHRRRENRPLPRELARDEAADTDPTRHAQDREFAGSLEETLKQLGGPYREVMTLHLCYGLSAKEIAHSLGRPAGTVRTQIVRGMERVRRVLPAGFAADGVVAAPGVSLASVRAEVIRHADAAARTAAGGAAGTSVMSLVVGVLVMKKVLVASTVVAALAGVAWLVGISGNG